MIVILPAFLLGCAQSENPEKYNKSASEFAEIGDPFILSESNIKALESLSSNGNGEASYDLFLHYTFLSNAPEDNKKADFWLNKAADQGYKNAVDLRNKSKSKE